MPIRVVAGTWLYDCDLARQDPSVQIRITSILTCMIPEQSVTKSGLAHLEQLIAGHGDNIAITMTKTSYKATHPPADSTDPAKKNVVPGTAARSDTATTAVDQDGTVSHQDMCTIPWFTAAANEIALLYGEKIATHMFTEGFVVISMPSLINSEAYALEIITPTLLSELDRFVVVSNAIAGLPRTAFVVDKNGHMDPSYFVVLADTVNCVVARTPVNRRQILDDTMLPLWARNQVSHLPPGVFNQADLDQKTKRHRYDTTRVPYVQRTVVTSVLNSILGLVDMCHTASDVTQHHMHNPPPRVLILDGAKPEQTHDNGGLPRLSSIIADSGMDLTAVEMDRQTRKMIEEENTEKKRELARETAIHENVCLIELPQGSVVAKDFSPAAEPSTLDDAQRRLAGALGISSLVGSATSGKSAQDRAQPWSMFAISTELQTKAIMKDTNSTILRVLAYLIAMFTPELTEPIKNNADRFRLHMSSENLTAPIGEDGDILGEAALVMASHQMAEQIIHWSWGPRQKDAPLKFQLPEYLVSQLKEKGEPATNK